MKYFFFKFKFIFYEKTATSPWKSSPHLYQQPPSRKVGVHTMESTLKKASLIWVNNQNCGKTVKSGANALIFLRMLGQNLKSTRFIAILIYPKSGETNDPCIYCTNNFSNTTSHYLPRILQQKVVVVGYICHCSLKITVYK